MEYTQQEIDEVKQYYQKQYSYLSIASTIIWGMNNGVIKSNALNIYLAEKGKK